MSVKVDTSKAEVHILVDDFDGYLKDNHSVIYITGGDVCKLGRTGKTGQTPTESVIDRYAVALSGRGSDLIVDDIIIHPRTSTKIAFNYDNEIRCLIRNYEKYGRISFSANVGEFQQENSNYESLINYDRSQHISQLLDIVKEYFGLSPQYDMRTTFDYRWKQNEDIDQIVNNLISYDTCLYAAYTGRGKTRIAIETAARLITDGGLVLVTTPIADTKQGFKDDIAKHHFGNDRNRKITYMDSRDFKNTTIDNIIARVQQRELIFVVITVQDLRWHDASVGEETWILRKKYQSLDGFIDLWIRDERHSQYNGMVTSNKLETLHAKKYMDLTATPYNCVYKYDTNQMVVRNLAWGLTHRQHTLLPEISIEAINLRSISEKIASLFTIEEGFDPRKLFARSSGEFLLEQEIITIMERFYTSTLSRNKNPLSISNDTWLSSVAKRCGMIVLPSGTADNGASEYIPALAALLNENVGKVFWIDSYSLDNRRPSGVSVGDYIEILLQEHQKVVILTCGKFTTGTNIPSLGHIVLLDNMSSISEFEQLMGRSIRFYEGKHRVKLYSIAPGNELKIILGNMQLTSEKICRNSQIKLLDCVPLSEHDGVKWNTFEAQDILGAIQEWYRLTAKRGVSSNEIQKSLIDYDLSGFKNKRLTKLIATVPKKLLSEDNGSKIKEDKRKAVNDDLIPNNTFLYKVVETIQCIIFEMHAIAHMTDDYNLLRVLDHPLINGGIFEKDIVCEVKTAILARPMLYQILQKDLDEKQHAYKSLSFREVYDQVFTNSKSKQKNGVVYLPVTLSERLIKSLDNCLYVNYTNILVVNALNGVLPQLLREKYPSAKITCAEVFPWFTQHLNKLGFNTIDWDNANLMKFDLIIGNPPYKDLADNGRQTNKSIWKDFIIKSANLLEKDGCMVFITPTGWCSPSDNGKLIEKVFSKLNLIYVDISDGVKDHFNGIGSTFGYTITVNQPYANKTVVNTNDGLYEIDLIKTKLITKIGMGIISKLTMSSHSRCQFKLAGKDYQYAGDGYHTDNKPDDAIYKNIHHVNSGKDYLPGTTIPVRWSKEKSPVSDRKKVVIPYNGPVNVIVDSGDYGVGWCQTLLLGDADLIDAANQVFNSKLFKFFANQRSTQYNETKNLNQFPMLDLTRLWTNDDLYNQFGLTKEEIDLIEYY